MRRIVSEEEAASAPNRRYRGVRVLRDGRVRLAEVASPELDVRVQRHTVIERGDERRAVYDSSNYVISIWSGDDLLLTLGVRRSRVQDACFNVALTPKALAKAVATVRNAGGGLERWITPGLTTTRLIVSRNTDSARAGLLKAIDALLVEERA